MAAMNIVANIMYGILAFLCLLWGLSLLSFRVRLDPDPAVDRRVADVLAKVMAVIGVCITGFPLYAVHTDQIDKRSLIWLVPLIVVVYSVLFSITRDVASWLLKKSGNAATGVTAFIIGGCLTVLQIFYAEEGASLWVSFRAGPIPIPLILITGLAAAGGAYITLVWIILQVQKLIWIRHTPRHR